MATSSRKLFGTDANGSEPVRKKSERWQTVVSFWPALLFNDADMRALRPRSNHHGLGQDPPDRECLLNHTVMPDGLSTQIIFGGPVIPTASYPEQKSRQLCASDGYGDARPS